MAGRRARDRSARHWRSPRRSRRSRPARCNGSRGPAEGVRAPDRRAGQAQPGADLVRQARQMPAHAVVGEEADRGLGHLEPVAGAGRPGGSRCARCQRRCPSRRRRSARRSAWRSNRAARSASIRVRTRRPRGRDPRAPDRRIRGYRRRRENMRPGAARSKTAYTCGSRAILGISFAIAAFMPELMALSLAARSSVSVHRGALPFKRTPGSCLGLRLCAEVSVGCRCRHRRTPAARQVALVPAPAVRRIRPQFHYTFQIRGKLSEIEFASVSACPRHDALWSTGSRGYSLYGQPDAVDIAAAVAWLCLSGSRARACGPNQRRAALASIGAARPVYPAADRSARTAQRQPAANRRDLAASNAQAKVRDRHGA